MQRWDWRREIWTAVSVLRGNGFSASVRRDRSHGEPLPTCFGTCFATCFVVCSDRWRILRWSLGTGRGGRGVAFGGDEGF